MSASTAQHHASGCVLAPIRSAWRWAALALASLSLSLITALLPVNIGYHLTSDTSSSHTPHVIADIGASKAYADAVPVQGAVDLLKEYADAAGLQYGTFVGAVAAIVTTSTGMVTGAADGIMLDSGLEKNLSNLVDAADYPDWSTLDAATQSQWGSKENYDAAKFNSLMNAFGFQDVAESYYGSYSAEGGGTFEPGEELDRKLKQIGRIGSRWSMGLGNTYMNVSSLLTNKQAIEQYFGAQPGYGFNGAGLTNWPSNIPTYLEIGNGSYCLVETHSGKYPRDMYVGVWATDTPVYSILVRNSRNSQVFANYWVLSFSESPYKVGAASRQQFDGNMPEPPEITPSLDAVYRAGINGHSYYWTTYGTDFFILGDVVVNSTLPINVFPRDSDFLTVLDLIMANGGVASNGIAPDLNGYPEIAPDPDEEIYYPEQGVTNNNSWNNYTTPTPIIRPDNPFNPGDTSGTDKWKDETEANTKQLGSVHFEKLFPFCLLYDITLLFQKMQSLGVLPEQNDVINSSELETQGHVTDQASQYLTVKLPISGFDPGANYINEDQTVDFDLTPLHDLLIMIRPAMQILLVVMLLFTLIDFWRGVLAG